MFMGLNMGFAVASEWPIELTAYAEAPAPVPAKCLCPSKRSRGTRAGRRIYFVYAAAYVRVGDAKASASVGAGAYRHT